MSKRPPPLSHVDPVDRGALRKLLENWARQGDAESVLLDHFGEPAGRALASLWTEAVAAGAVQPSTEGVVLTVEVSSADDSAVLVAIRDRNGAVLASHYYPADRFLPGEPKGVEALAGGLDALIASANEDLT